MTEAAQRHEDLVARLRESTAVSGRVLDAFERLPRHIFLPEVPLQTAYADDAIVTHDEGGVPTSSSTQPSLMARMIELLELRPGDRVLEIGAGTGYNAAVMAELGAAVTSVELQPDVADAAREHLSAAGVPLLVEGSGGSPAAGEGGHGSSAAGGHAAAEPGTVSVVTGDGAAPPAGPYDRVIVTAGCWALPAAVVGALNDGGVLVAPLRLNGIELVLGLRREGDVLRGRHGIPCGFMPMRGGEERPWRWKLGGGGVATADADLGVEGRGALDRLLATPGREVEDPLALTDGEHALGALLWLGLQGDPLIALALPGHGNRPPWTIGLDVMPASLLVIELASGFATVASATLHGGDGALRACLAGMAAWREAGSPGPGALELTVERRGERDTWSLPYPTADGAATMVRGAHRWTLRYAG
jgi:protein-L-isoaspartate(D-aspartate) O-methyltransferase